MDGASGVRFIGNATTLISHDGFTILTDPNFPREVLPIHHDDYDVFTSSIEDFHDRMDEAGLADRIRYVDRGETYPIGHRTKTDGHLGAGVFRS